MAGMKVAQVSKAGGPFEIVERDIPQPGPGQLRVKVEAWEICHSDVVVKEGLYPRLKLPRVPGLEISGRIDAVGADVTQWTPGQRVGVGWHGGHCFVCEYCRRGDFHAFAETRRLRASALTGLRRVHDRSRGGGGRVAGRIVRAGSCAASVRRYYRVQFHAQLGSESGRYGCRAGNRRTRSSWGSIRTADGLPHDCHWPRRRQGTTSQETRCARFHRFGRDRRPTGVEEAGWRAPDSSDGARCTVDVGHGGRHRKLLVVGVPREPISVSVMEIVSGKSAIQGWPSGTAIDSEETLRFSARNGVKPMIEKYPLTRVADAYKQMISGRARFRVVLTMGCLS